MRRQNSVYDSSKSQAFYNARSQNCQFNMGFPFFAKTTNRKKVTLKRGWWSSETAKLSADAVPGPNLAFDLFAAYGEWTTPSLVVQCATRDVRR